MTKSEYYKTRKPFKPESGETYENEGGGRFVCVDPYPTQRSAIMQNVASGWRFFAHGVGIYEDGKIDWDYSLGGHFAGERKRAET